MNRGFGPRLCPKDQPQRSPTPMACRNNSNRFHIRTCCGWCCAHSRAPTSVPLQGANRRRESQGLLGRVTRLLFFELYFA